MESSLSQLERISTILEGRNWDDPMVLARISDASVRVRQALAKIAGVANPKLS
jgi:hypothetical protein